jgi:hypothetical protein
LGHDAVPEILERLHEHSLLVSKLALGRVDVRQPLAPVLPDRRQQVASRIRQRHFQSFERSLLRLDVGVDLGNAAAGVLPALANRVGEALSVLVESIPRSRCNVSAPRQSGRSMGIS